MIPVETIDGERRAMILTGIIVHGKHLGRTIGFPTANLKPDAPFSGQRGVYAGRFTGENGVNQMCMVNIGTHPTVPEGEPTIEAHLLDYSGDLYGQRVTIELTDFLRPERRFPSLEALKEQLTSDREHTRKVLADRLH